MKDTGWHRDPEGCDYLRYITTKDGEWLLTAHLGHYNTGWEPRVYAPDGAALRGEPEPRNSNDQVGRAKERAYSMFRERWKPRQADLGII